MQYIVNFQFKIIKAKKEEQKIGRAGSLLDRYGGEEHLNSELDLLLGQTERYVEYDIDGQPINPNKKKDYFKSKYPEDVYNGDHTSVWGSWFNEALGWGYSCCHQNDKHSICLGEKGKRMAQREIKYRKEHQDEVDDNDKFNE